jgi:hypothetical protein
MGPEPPGTYEEYLAKHPPQPFSILPVRKAPPQELFDGTQRVLVIVNNALLPLIQTNIDRYVSDLQAAGYAPDLYSSTFGTPEELKSFIISQSAELVGCVFVGSLPCAWYEIEDDFEEYGYASFPCDLYFMDLDGAWEDFHVTEPMQSGIYDFHYYGTGDTAPEIFVGRIDASTMTGDAEHVQVNAYLDKLHMWYTGKLPMTDYALTYTEDDWAGFPYFSEDISYAFDDNEAIKGPETGMRDYRDNRLPAPDYHFIQLSCHSSPFAHYFTRQGLLYNDVIRAIPPKALF